MGKKTSIIAANAMAFDVLLLRLIRETSLASGLFSRCRFRAAHRDWTGEGRLVGLAGI
jgi:hypothetical protein